MDNLLTFFKKQSPINQINQSEVERYCALSKDHSTVWSRTDVLNAMRPGTIFSCNDFVTLRKYCCFWGPEELKCKLHATKDGMYFYTGDIGPDFNPSRAGAKFIVRGCNQYEFQCSGNTDFYASIINDDFPSENTVQAFNDEDGLWQNLETKSPIRIKNKDGQIVVVQRSQTETAIEKSRSQKSLIKKTFYDPKSPLIHFQIAETIQCMISAIPMNRIIIHDRIEIIPLRALTKKR